MSDEGPLARALRIAMQNHEMAYGTRNALDQGEYGYGTPVTYTEPRSSVSSSALHSQGPWLRDYMPATLADLLSQYLTYAPMAVPAMRARVMENGLAPHDFALANRHKESNAWIDSVYRDQLLQHFGDPKQPSSVYSTSRAGWIDNPLGPFRKPGQQEPATNFSDKMAVQGFPKLDPANRR